jgi:hypothetical protein
MTKLDYRVIEMGSIVEPNARSVASAIDGAGEEGWELAATSPPTVHHDQGGFGEETFVNNWFLIFKRPAEASRAITMYGGWTGTSQQYR